MAGTAIRVGIPIGFPLGGHTTKAKVAEAVEAVANGDGNLDILNGLENLLNHHLLQQHDIVLAPPHPAQRREVRLSRRHRVHHDALRFALNR
ncbi:MAG: hypothetical protein HC794_10385 [Nitrospiraceae bacterium]|nr:hypothetical protein [Nitrospiraceae bacterium]